jgi:hypothetical protein
LVNSGRGCLSIVRIEQSDILNLYDKANYFLRHLRFMQYYGAAGVIVGMFFVNYHHL